jgi:hypothetical protein
MGFRSPTRRQALLQCVLVAVVWLACVGLLTAAALVPAPAVIQPVLVVACVGLAMAVATQLPGSIAVLRAGREDRVLEKLRVQLDELPETEHPLGL